MNWDLLQPIILLMTVINLLTIELREDHTVEETAPLLESLRKVYPSRMELLDL